ncbi:MAG: DUF58 domain-containing protein [Nitrospinota bacterium]|nr:MAG: DUF58 domain-containing protein [Nitrospinota bacterium]
MKETILQHVARIPLYIRWPANHFRLGQHPSRQRGSGLEFDQIREYQLGEGVGRINWAATARRGGTPLLVNTYYEEKEITVMLLVDMSASMDFGSYRVTKRTLAAEVSASLVYSALLAYDRIGLAGFSDRLECYFPPRRSSRYQHMLPEAILTHPTHQGHTDFRIATEVAENRVPSPALLFLLSDFLTEDEEQLSQMLDRLRFRHDLIALVMADPREEEVPAGEGRIAVRDLESGQRVVYRLSRTRVNLKRQAQLASLFQRFHIPYIRITSQTHYIDDLTQLFLRRRREGG